MILYDESIGFQMNRTSKRMTRYLNSALDRYNITLEQWVIILKLSQQDQLSQKTLAQKVEKDQPTLARILDILERKSLISRQPQREDRRSFSIHLTTEGRNLHAQITPFLEDLFQKILAGLSEEKIMIFTEVLNQMMDNIQAKEQSEVNR